MRERLNAALRLVPVRRPDLKTSRMEKEKGRQKKIIAEAQFGIESRKNSAQKVSREKGMERVGSLRKKGGKKIGPL